MARSKRIGGVLIGTIMLMASLTFLVPAVRTAQAGDNTVRLKPAPGSEDILISVTRTVFPNGDKISIRGVFTSATLGKTYSIHVDPANNTYTVREEKCTLHPPLDTVRQSSTIAPDYPISGEGRLTVIATTDDPLGYDLCQTSHYLSYDYNPSRVYFRERWGELLGR